LTKTLKQIREGKKLSLREAAKMTGVGYGTYACIEQGSITPTPEICIQIGDGLNINPSIIIQMFIF
jgi:transcriptional regulator with XRE-family HTH domain